MSGASPPVARRRAPWHLEPTRLEALRAAAGKWATVLAGLAAAQGLSALALVLIARRVAAVSYGQYLSVYFIASLLVVLPAFGLESWLLARGEADPVRLGQLWRGALRARLALLGAWGCALAPLAAILPHDTFPPGLLALCAVSLAGDSLAAVSHAALRSLGRHGWVAACQGAVNSALLAVAIGLPSDDGAVVLFAVGRAAVSGLGAWAAWRLVRARVARSIEAAPVRDLLHEARPFVLADLSATLYLRADLVLVSIFIGAAGSGVYGPALSLVNVCFLAPNALYLLVLPILSRAYREPDRSFRGIAVAQLVLQAATGIALALAAFAFAPVIVRVVYSEAYEASAGILRLLSPLLAVKGVSFGLAAVLTASRRQSRRTAVQVTVAIANVLANVAVIGSLGITGVAGVYVASEGLLCAGYGLANSSLWRTERSGHPPGAGHHLRGGRA